MKEGRSNDRNETGMAAPRGIHIAGMGLANILTIARVAAVPVIVLLFFLPPLTGRTLAFILFFLAAFTDWLDGYLARRWNQTTPLGRMLDPIADKLLIVVVLMMLVFDASISGWHVWAGVIILFREILVSGMREHLAALDVTLHVTRLAKWKTTLQMLALGLLMLVPVGELLTPHFHGAALTLLWLAAALTFYTGYDYMRAALPVLQQEQR